MRVVGVGFSSHLVSFMLGFEMYRVLFQVLLLVALAAFLLVAEARKPKRQADKAKSKGVGKGRDSKVAIDKIHFYL